MPETTEMEAVTYKSLTGSIFHLVILLLLLSVLGLRCCVDFSLVAASGATL